jgi:hypothetical protein
MEYLDFAITIERGTGREYPLGVRSPAGEATTTLAFPFDDLALDSRLKDVQIALLRSGGLRRQMLSPEEQGVRDFGRLLFDALMRDDVRSLYDRSQQQATEQERGLRLQLRIQAPELAALPWEFLFDERNGEYVCLSRNTPVIRAQERMQPALPLTVKPPLRILCMVVSPRDREQLDVAREKQRIEEATKTLQAQGRVELVWLDGQTKDDLQQAMWRGPWHVFHFVGHGGFDQNLGEGLIVLADAEGRSDMLTATDLSRLLGDQRSLRLVLLNACEGARGDVRDVFSSTAMILSRRGIPAVLAMQYAITDRAAVEFARVFYRALTYGMPVDEATAEARKAVSLAVTNSFEWGTPVLFMNATGGALFELPAQKEAPTQAPPPVPESEPNPAPVAQGSAIKAVRTLPPEYDQFYRFWAINSTLGWLLGTLVSARILSTIPSEMLVLAYLLAGATVAALISLLQLVVLRRFVGAFDPWVVAGAIGGGASGVLIAILGTYVDSVFMWSQVLVGAVTGLVIGLAQWVVMQRGGYKATYWIFASLAAWTIAQTILSAISDASSDQLPELVVLSLGGLIGGLAYALLTAVAMRSIVRDRLIAPS